MKGTFTPKLDDAHRLALPPRYREELSGGVSIMCAQERCLGIYLKSVMDAMLESYNQVQSTHKKVRDYQRWMQSRLVDVVPDRQGRVLLTSVQRQWAGLERDVVVIGAGNRLEVWNPDRWAEYSLQLDEEFENFDGDILTQF
ncbi:MAG: division/cell wall cluster transcriptional repressor MraZ [Propionibacteriaceae bacterium]|jgi:MraZ protein|nr:division/cell wall cluster transcriptional repressor MraZ [Propionibacteriaceae bacterium]